MLLYNNRVPEPMQIIYIPNKLVNVSKYQAISVFLPFQASAEVVNLQWTKICFERVVLKASVPFMKEFIS